MIDVASLFAPGGPLARALPTFEPRPQQERMASEVMGALVSGGPLLVEAGTGVGKSIAYLVPAILWATREGSGGADERRVIVSTHTRALQEQLSRKDLPFLERALAPSGITFRHALLMGSENYLCVQRLEQARTRRTPTDSGAGPALEALAKHARGALSGLRTEIPFAVPDGLWERLRRDRDICLGARGPFWESCLYRGDLARSREADLVVVNHALFFLDLATGGRILPPHAAVILDEAHRVEEVAAAQLGVSLSDRGLVRLLDDLGGRGPDEAHGEGSIPDEVRDDLEDLRGVALRFFADCRREAAALLPARGGERGSGRGDERNAARGDAGAGFTARVRQPGLVEDRLQEPLERLAEKLDRAARGASDPVTAQSLTAFAERARDQRRRARLFLEQSMADAVYWIEAPARRSGAELNVTPIEVAPFLRQRLFDGARRVVLTSATLTSARTFAHVRRRLGVTNATEVALGSPYDYRTQALLYLPPAMPDPGAEPGEFAEAVIRECSRILAACRGGAFILFTSYALLNRVHDALAQDADLRDLRFFRHEAGAASAILEAFRGTRRGVLLGTLTFWQGVDVPGDALRCVILTRLPFEVPDHPLAEARAETTRERGGDPFVEDSLPEAILTFRQGFGRLIRTREDRGLVAALDPRLSTRGYGQAFLESLPDCRRTESLDEVRSFFAATPAGLAGA